VPVRPTPARLAAGLLLAGGAGLLLAPAASAAPAAPSSTPVPTRSAAGAPTVAPRSSLPRQAPAPSSATSSPGRIAVPAGGSPRTQQGGFGPSEISLAGAGILLVAGGAVAVRRQHR